MNAARPLCSPLRYLLHALQLTVLRKQTPQNTIFKVIGLFYVEVDRKVFANNLSVLNMFAAVRINVLNPLWWYVVPLYETTRMLQLPAFELHTQANKDKEHTC